MASKLLVAPQDSDPKTVHVHRANLMDKLNVNNNVELAHRMLDSW